MSMTKEQALRQIEGLLDSYIKGKSSRNMLLGRIKGLVKNYGAGVLDEIEARIERREHDPTYLPTVPQEEKIGKLKQAKDAVKIVRQIVFS